MSTIRSDVWLIVALAVTLVVYGNLAVIQPTGEGWGRGWNMVAFLIYAAPTAVLAGAVALWRSGKVVGRSRMVARVVGAAALVFPLVCALVIRVKA